MKAFGRKNPVKAELRAARERYGSAPSHAPAGQAVESGTYCAITAFTRHGYSHPVHTLAAVGALYRAIGFESSLVEFNAEHTTEEVLAAFDRAIEAA